MCQSAKNRFGASKIVKCEGGLLSKRPVGGRVCGTACYAAATAKRGVRPDSYYEICCAQLGDQVEKGRAMIAAGVIQGNRCEW